MSLYVGMKFSGLSHVFVDKH